MPGLGIQQCASANFCDGEFDRVKDWITVLEKAGLLLLRAAPHPALVGQTMTVVSPDGAHCQALLAAGAAEPAASAPSEPPAEPVSSDSLAEPQEAEGAGPSVDVNS